MAKKNDTVDARLFAGQVYQEYGYRNGYAEGYWTALTNFYKLMDAGLSKKKSFKYCRNFFTQELIEWRDGDCTKEQLPPQLKVDK